MQASRQAGRQAGRQNNTQNSTHTPGRGQLKLIIQVEGLSMSDCLRRDAEPGRQTGIGTD
eukprot:9462781-Alexandrium_andersonii.AAC.1